MQTRIRSAGRRADRARAEARHNIAGVPVHYRAIGGQLMRCDRPEPWKIQLEVKLTHALQSVSAFLREQAQRDASVGRT